MEKHLVTFARHFKFEKSTLLLTAVLYHFISFAQAPPISSFSPSSGTLGSTVTINGSGFNTIPSGNKVYFGNVAANVITASATQLTVSLPQGAACYPVSVTNTATSTSFQSRLFFTPTFSGEGKSFSAASLSTPVNLAIGYQNDLTTGDVDGDGKPDLVSIDNATNSIFIIRNTGSSTVNSGSFAPSVSFTVPGIPSKVQLADLDADGKLDLLVLSQASRYVCALRNKSVSGTIDINSFEPPYYVGLLYNPLSFAIGDLDNDGKPDIAIINQSNTILSVIRNFITYPGPFDFNSFYLENTIPLPGLARNIQIGDLDRDGKQDLVISKTGGGFAVMRNTNTSTYLPLAFAPALSFSTPGQSDSFSIADVDGDGFADLVFPCLTANKLTVARNSSSIGSITSTSFLESADFPAGANPLAPAIGDLNGDGKPDILTVNSTGNSFSIFRNTSQVWSMTTSSIDSKVDYAISNPRQTNITDIDGDGKPDLVILYANGIALYQNQVAEVNNSAPVINSFAPLSASPGSTISITGSGFDPNPSNNVVSFGGMKAAVSSASTNSLSVIVPKGAQARQITVTNNTTHLSAMSSKVFLPTFAGPGGSFSGASFGSRIDLPVGTEFDLAIGDLDEDGKPDLVTVDPINHVVSVLKNQSTAGTINTSSFAAKVDFAVAQNPNTIILRDMDGDGKLDLVILSIASRAISILRNITTPGTINSASFEPRVDYRLASTPYGNAVADINNDGRPEVIIANISGGLSILRNLITSPGTLNSNSFACEVSFMLSRNTRNVQVADLNDDGKQDLVFSNTGNGISLLQNLGSSGKAFAGNTFSTDYAFSTPDQGDFFSIADMDRDGKVDLIVPNKNTNNITLLQNTGATTIGTSSLITGVNFNAGNYPIATAIADLNGDGRPDIAAANISSNSLSLYRNNSNPGVLNTGTLDPKYDLPVNGANQPVIADLDGDNAPDLVVLYNGGISIFRNLMGPALLPLTLVSFTGEMIQGKADLKWTTINEEQTDNFQIEHAVDGIHFSSIAIRKASGFSNGMRNYGFEHTSPGPGYNYYRLKMNDLNGRFTYSQTIRLHMNAASPALLSIIPGVVHDKATIIHPPGDRSEIRFYNAAGQIVKKMQPDNQITFSEVDLSKFSSGIYFIQWSDGKQLLSSSFMKQ